MWRHACNWENILALVLHELRIYTFAIEIVAIPSDCFHGDRYYLHVFACVPSAILLMFLQWLELFQYWRIVCLTMVPVYSCIVYCLHMVAVPWWKQSSSIPSGFWQLYGNSLLLLASDPLKPHQSICSVGFCFPYSFHPGSHCFLAVFCLILSVSTYHLHLDYFVNLKTSAPFIIICNSLLVLNL